MINSPESADQLLSNANSQPLRRPGWGLIHDVRPLRQIPPRVAGIQPESRPQPATATVLHNLTPAQTKKSTRKQRLLQWLQKHALVITTPLVIFVSIRLSAFLVVGEGLIIAYGLAAVIWRIPSRISFWLTTMVLAGIGIEFLLLPGMERANNSALFVFLLLCIGLISSILETRRIILGDKSLRRR